MRCFRPVWLPLGLMTLSTAACGTAVSDTCPALVAYDQAAQTKLADELKALPADAEIRVMIADYGATRAQIRACRSAGQ